MPRNKFLHPVSSVSPGTESFFPFSLAAHRTYWCISTVLRNSHQGLTELLSQFFAHRCQVQKPRGTSIHQQCQRCESPGSLSNETRDNRWIQSGDGGEAYQQRQVVPHLIRFKHHLPVYQIVLTDHLLTLPLLSRGEAPLNPEVCTRVPRYPTSPAVPSEGTSHHSPYLTQVSGISALGLKVYSV